MTSVYSKMTMPAFMSGQSVHHLFNQFSILNQKFNETETSAVSIFVSSIEMESSKTGLT